MAKKLCELCQQECESDKRFGVGLCRNCLDGYSKAMSGDVDAATRFSNPQNFPNATEAAQKYIINSVANCVKRIEAKQQEKQRQQSVGKKEQKREEYAKSIGVTYEEKTKNNGESSVDEMYIDIGKKIKGWAKWIFIFGAIMSVIGAIVMLFTAQDNERIYTALLTLLLGPAFAWVSSWLLYAFGELVDKTCENERNTQNILKLMLENNVQKNKE